MADSKGPAKPDWGRPVEVKIVRSTGQVVKTVSVSPGPCCADKKKGVSK